MKSIEFNGIIGGIRAKKDGSLGITMSTPEMLPEEKTAMLYLQGINLDVKLKPLDFKIDEPLKVKQEINSKTQSQRIRSVLYLLWKHEGEPDTFEVYYHHKTEKYIEFLKDKLEDYK